MNLIRFVGKHRGATAWLFGKGPSLDDWLNDFDFDETDWRDPNVVRIVVNEAVLVVPEPHYFFAHDVLGIDRSMDPLNHGFKVAGSRDVDPRVSTFFPENCVSILREEQIPAALKHEVDSAKIFGYRKGQQERELLDLSALELAKLGALYAESATIQSGCHFAKLTGCVRVVLVGVDGGRGVARVFDNMGCARGPWYDKNRLDTHRILDAMGMPFTVWGE
jgi:hypothetical protein